MNALPWFTHKEPEKAALKTGLEEASAAENYNFGLIFQELVIRKEDWLRYQEEPT